MRNTDLVVSNRLKDKLECFVQKFRKNNSGKIYIYKKQGYVLIVTAARV